MKRLLVLAAAVVGMIAMVGPQPVKADAAAPTDNASLTGATITGLNEILGNSPSPAGWHSRHVCFGIDWLGRGECLYFPFPT